MKAVTTFTFALLTLISCSDEKVNPKKPAASNTTTAQVEKFESFFEKFTSDSVFQKSRVQFPLNAEILDIDTEKSNASTIKADEWDFLNAKSQGQKYLFKTRKENNQYIVNIQLEDTGVYVDYIFEQKGSKWMLVKIVDQST